MRGRRFTNFLTFRYLFLMHMSPPSRGKMLTGATVILILCHSCHSPQPDTGSETAKKEKGIMKKPASSYQDSLTIDFRAAVFFQPDSLQMQKIKSVNEPR